MNAKKILIVVSILLVLSLGTLLVYNFFLKTPPGGEGAGTGALPSASPSGGSQTGGSSSLPSNGGQTGQSQNAPASKIKAISQEAVLSPTIGENGQTVKYYTRSNGNVWESDFLGSSSSLKKISATTLNGLIKATWSPDETKVIGWFSDSNKIKKYFYNYANGQSSLLNGNIGSVDFSPDSKRIAYLFIDAATGQNNISVANPDGTNWKNIFKTRLDNLAVEWVDNTKISLTQPASGLAQGLLYALNPNTGDFTKILSDIFGLNVKWSPKADKILYSSTNDRGQSPKLSLSNENGTNFKDLKLAGLADKCVWSNDDRTIFCALPQEFSQNAVWPDDYYKGLVILADDFYKINLETNEKTKILGSTNQVGYDAQDLFLSPKEDYLFFINRRDGLLWSLKLQ